MNFIEILLLAVALSVDAAVCSIILGKKYQGAALKWRYAVIVSFAFGFFQFFMPLVGFYGGKSLINLIADFDHWVGFGLLALVSMNMLKETLWGKHEEIVHLSPLVVLSLALATSIDALAVGFSISMFDSHMLYIASVIGIVCFTTVFYCFVLGAYLSRFTALDRGLNVIGALILMGIGFGILIEHGVLPL